MGKEKRTKRVRSVQDPRSVRLVMELTWKQYDILKSSIVYYGENFKSKEINYLINQVTG